VFTYHALDLKFLGQIRITLPAFLLTLLFNAYGFGDRDQGMVSASQITILKPLKLYPAIDSHTHFSASGQSATARNYELAVKTMDLANIAVSVVLTGENGNEFEKNLSLARKYPGRFVLFCGVPLKGDDWKVPDLTDRLVGFVQNCHRMGGKGFGEIWKWALYRRINWDDARLDPMWNELEKLQMPINWHVADPSRYWRPESVYNTLEAPSYYKDKPLKQELLMQQERVLQKHPKLIVIAAHSDYLADQIPLLVYRFEKYPNYHIDLSATIEEWGRVPEEFIDIAKGYSDRILYGTDARYDAPADAAEFEKKLEDLRAFHLAHFLFLGSDQRFLPTPFTGNYGRTFVGWKNGYSRYVQDGVHLPENVLENIYYKNARRLFGISGGDLRVRTEPVQVMQYKEERKAK
jgi:uncharacterized protein